MSLPLLVVCVLVVCVLVVCATVAEAAVRVSPLLLSLLLLPLLLLPHPQLGRIFHVNAQLDLQELAQGGLIQRARRHVCRVIQEHPGPGIEQEGRVLLAEALGFGVLRHVNLAQALPRLIKPRKERLHHPLLCRPRGVGLFVVACSLVRGWTRMVLGQLWRMVLPPSIRPPACVLRASACTRNASLATPPTPFAARGCPAIGLSRRRLRRVWRV